MTDKNRQRAELHRLELPEPVREHLRGPSPLGGLLDDYVRFAAVVAAAHSDVPRGWLKPEALQPLDGMCDAELATVRRDVEHDIFAHREIPDNREEVNRDDA